MTRSPPGRSTAPLCKRCWTIRRPRTGSWPIRTPARWPWTARSTSSTPQTCSCTPGILPGPPARTTGSTPASVPSCWPRWSRWKRSSGPPASTGPGSRCPTMPTRRPGCWDSSAAIPSGHPQRRRGDHRARERHALAVAVVASVCEQGGDEHVGQPALVGLWGGALYLAAELARAGRGERTICQLTTASHISRLTGPATVRVFLRAPASVAALPASHLEACHRQLDALLPGQLGRAESVLEADLANVNAILHPPGMACNAGWIEATAGTFGFYAEGSGRAVAQVMDAIDRDRLALAGRLGVRAVPFPELFCQLGFTTGNQPHAGGAY